MKKSLQVFIISLLYSNLSTAGIYLKGFVGNTENSFQYQVNRTLIDTGLSTVAGTTEEKLPTSTNLMTGGAGIGIDNIVQVNDKVKLGLEASIERQTEHSKFTINNGSAETALLDQDMTLIDITNQFQGSISLVATFYDFFYVKVGPAGLRQKIKDSVYQSNTPRKTASLTKEQTKDHYGFNLATGLTYRFSRYISIFSEYSFSYFDKKNLYNFVYDDDTIVVSGANDFQVTQYSKKLKVDQSKFFVGLQFNFDTYKTPSIISLL